MRERLQGKGATGENEILCTGSFCPMNGLSGDFGLAESAGRFTLVFARVEVRCQPVNDNALERSMNCQFRRKSTSRQGGEIRTAPALGSGSAQVRTHGLDQRHVCAAAEPLHRRADHQRNSRGYWAFSTGRSQWDLRARQRVASGCDPHPHADCGDGGRGG